jgi:CRISPR-associated protein Csy2
MNDVGFYLLFDRVQIQGANTVSSPITYGFPAITGFLGAVHALSRKISPEQEIQLDGVLVASHTCDVKRYRQHPFADYTLNQSRNPVKKNGQTASIIEEGKVDLTVSLMVEVRCSMQSYNWLQSNDQPFVKEMEQKLYSQRIAGGSVHRIGEVKLLEQAVSDTEWKAALLPGFVLMDARRDLIEITSELQTKDADKTALDALIEVASLHHVPSYDDKGKLEWKATSAKSGRGWLVPMPVGFQAIAPEFEAGALAHCRNPEYPSQYVECLYGLGKWVFPHRLKNINDCFWRYDNQQPELFLATQTNR